MESIRELIEMHRMNYLWKDTAEGSPLIQAKIEALEELLHELPTGENPLQGLLQEWVECGEDLCGGDLLGILTHDAYVKTCDLVHRTQAALQQLHETEQG